MWKKIDQFTAIIMKCALSFHLYVGETETVNLQIGATRMEQNKNQFACKLFLVSFSLRFV